MAALNFPANPSLNDEYSANSATWRWNGTAWVRLGTGAQGYQGVQGADGAQGYQGYQGTAGSAASIQNEANNRVITATSTPGTLNANQYFVHDGTYTGIGTDALVASLHVMDAYHWDESTIWEDNAGQLIRNVDTEIAIGKNSSPGNIWIQGRNSSSLAQDITINPSGGNIGIGTDNPGQKLHVYEPSGDSQCYVKIENNRSRNAAVQFTTTLGSWYVGQGIGVDADRFMVYDSQQRMGIDSSGNMTLNTGNLVIGTSGKGIDFSATSDATGMTSELLDDYEEGTWVPRLSGTGGGEYTPGGSNVGYYVKVGNLVKVSCTLHWTAQVTAYSSNLVITGLPYASRTTYRHAGTISALSSGLTLSTNYNRFSITHDPNSSQAYIIQNKTDGNGYAHSAGTVATSGLIYSISWTYVTT